MAAKKKESKEKSKDTSKSVEKLVDEIAKLSVLELSELVDALKEKLGVEAAAPVAAAPAAGGATDEAAGKEEESGGAQTVVLTGAGENRVQVIKALREIDQNLGLKDAKDMTENLPAEVIKEGKPEEVKEAADKLKAAGATVELK
jgi:large subunit ribosomal protein L7/L12